MPEIEFDPVDSIGAGQMAFPGSVAGPVVTKRSQNS
jgi:hypothetical protein